jgi:hypothetical protein
MCQAFSGIGHRDKSVTWKFGVDHHSELVTLAGLKDNSADPNTMEFFRFEITPKNGNYLFPDEWVFKVDESITPAWLTPQHREACFAAHKKWLKKLDKILVRKDIVHPFKIDPPIEITKEHINMLRKWDSVSASVRASVRASVGASVRASVRASVGASVSASVGASVGASVRDSVGASVMASVGASVMASVGDSVWAYTGSFFILPVWKYIKHPRGKYPFAPCVQLWMLGLVPGFDGTTWRLHGGPKAKVMFEISAEELRGKKVRLNG